MRIAAFVVLGLLGCATVGKPTTAPTPTTAARAKVAAPAKNEVVVIGVGPERMPGMRPQDEGTDFKMVQRTAYRCTKVKPTPENPRGGEQCRAIRGESRDPDPGRVERAKVWQ